MGWGGEYMELYMLFTQPFYKSKMVPKIKPLYFENQVDNFLSLAPNTIFCLDTLYYL